MGVRVMIYEDYQENKDTYWNLELDVLPRVGDWLVIATAKAGDWHRVESVTHHIGGGLQRCVIVAERQRPLGLRQRILEAIDAEIQRQGGDPWLSTAPMSEDRMIEVGGMLSAGDVALAVMDALPAVFLRANDNGEWA